MCYYELCRVPGCKENVHKPCRSIVESGTCERRHPNANTEESKKSFTICPATYEKPCIAFPFDRSLGGRAISCNKCKRSANSKSQVAHRRRIFEDTEKKTIFNGERNAGPRAKKHVKLRKFNLPAHFTSTLGPWTSSEPNHLDSDSGIFTGLNVTRRPPPPLHDSALVSAPIILAMSSPARPQSVGLDQAFVNPKNLEIDSASSYRYVAGPPPDPTADYTPKFSLPTRANLFEHQ